MENIHESVGLLDTYLRIPTVSSEINAETVEQVQKFWQVLGLELEPLWAEKPFTDMRILHGGLARHCRHDCAK